MSLDKMIRMANQIATFFASQPEAGRVAGVANHINDFWEPRMRVAFLEAVAAGTLEGLHPLVLEAMDDIKYPMANV